MRLPGQDLIREEFPCDQSKRRATMAESDMITRNAWKLTEDRLTISRNGFRTDAIGVESKLGISLKYRGRLSKEALNS
jgi:hypothetical protein